MKLQLFPLILGFTAWLAACGTAPVASTDQHLTTESTLAATATIPPTVRPVPLPPPPRATPKAERYSVVVNAVPVQELLFALARDAKVNVDVHPGVEGTVTLNAIDQTLPQILARIAKQVDLRFEMDGPNLVVMPDTPYLKNYRVDYLNMARDTSETISLATQIATTGTGTMGGAGGASASGNNSTASVTNTSRNRFWDTLILNVKDILRETDKVFPEGSLEAQTAQTGQERSASSAPSRATSRSSRSGTTTTTITPTGENAPEENVSQVERHFTFREAASVIANAESGVLTVRATSRQHEKVQEFLDMVIGSARRQVLIEATIVEVGLNDNYQAGVDWQRLINLGDGKILFNMSNGFSNATPALTLTYTNPNASNISSAIRLLSVFGTTRVLSSPKLMVLNNQSAVMKVVDNRVYFTIQAQTTSLNQNSTQNTFTTTPISVPIGLVMNVTPQISEDDVVSLNVRPTISRITDFVKDPNPSLQDKNLSAPIVNLVPEIQTREMESILKVASGQIAVLGGLMQDSVDTSRNGVPVLSHVPIVGDAFSFRNDTSIKTELVIFLRPTVIREASINGDLKALRSLLPDDRFLKRPEAELMKEGPAGRNP